MASYQVQREIQAPPDKVWTVMTDVEAWPEWTASIASMERLDDAPFGVGSRVRIRQPKFPAVVWRVTDYEPGRYFAWGTSSAGMKVTAGHRIDPAGSGRSRVTLSLRQKGPLAPVFGLLFKRLTLRYMNLEAEGLARRSES